MTKGHLIFAQNSDIDYVRQAYALALSIKQHNKINNVCLMTNDSVPFEYTKAFDHIVSIPWGDAAEKSEWKIENRWKIIYASPYQETLVYDSDMLVCSSNDHWWDYLENKNIALAGNVQTYKGEIVTNNFYRKSFVENNLPDLYFGIHYIKKNKRSYEFYKWLEIIVKNWKQYYSIYTPNNPQKFCSMDVSSAIAATILDAKEEFGTGNPLTFTHMKPAIQNWHDIPDTWQSATTMQFTDHADLKISNFLQTGVFHYTENDFLTDDIIKKLEAVYESRN